MLLVRPECCFLRPGNIFIFKGLSLLANMWLLTSQNRNKSSLLSLLPLPFISWLLRTVALMWGGPWSPASQPAAVGVMATGLSATASVAMSTTTAARWGLRRRPICTRPPPRPSTPESAAPRSLCAPWKLLSGTFTVCVYRHITAATVHMPVMLWSMILKAYVNKDEDIYSAFISPSLFPRIFILYPPLCYCYHAHLLHIHPAFSRRPKSTQSSVSLKWIGVVRWACPPPTTLWTTSSLTTRRTTSMTSASSVSLASGSWCVYTVCFRKCQ